MQALKHWYAFVVKNGIGTIDGSASATAQIRQIAHYMLVQDMCPSMNITTRFPLRWRASGSSGRAGTSRWVIWLRTE